MNLKLVIIIPITMTKIIDNHQKATFCLLLASYVDKPFLVFANRLRTSVKCKFNAHLNTFYKTTKMST